MENLQGTSSRPQSSHVLDQLWMFKVWDASCGIATQYQQSNTAYELKLGSRTVAVWTSPRAWKGTVISSLKSRGQLSNSIWDSPCKDELFLNYFVLTYATYKLPGEYSKLFCAVINKVTVIIREMQSRPRELLFSFCIKVMETLKGFGILSGLQWLWGFIFSVCPCSFYFFHCFNLFTVKQKWLSFTASLNLKHKTPVLFVVLVLAELIFFTVADMGSCFRFCRKRCW